MVRALESRCRSGRVRKLSEMLKAASSYALATVSACMTCGSRHHPAAQGRYHACRPGFGNGIYAITINGQLQTFPLCFPDTGCVNAPLEDTPITGTTVAWAATAATPTETPGATSKASATILALDRGGLYCIGSGESYSATRTQYELTCLLLESPDDVPTTPVFPDVPPTLPPRSSGGGSNATRGRAMLVAA